MNFSQTEQQDQEDTLLMQYAKVAEKLVPLEPATISDQSSDQSAQNANFFAGLTFFFYGFIDESSVLLVRDVQNAGGQLVSETYSDFVDYLILATDITEFDLQIRAKNTVNDLWLVCIIIDNNEKEMSTPCAWAFPRPRTSQIYQYD